MSGIDRKTVGFIGGGNMAEAMVRGLVAGPLGAQAVLVAEPVAARRRQLHRRYGIGVTEDLSLIHI